MGCKMVITFVGHSRILNQNRVKEIVKKEIESNITDSGGICYLGGYGDFDNICALACKELKSTCNQIETVYVSPYITLAEQKKIEDLKQNGFCDSSLYPPIEKVPLRLAILKRNEWMVKNSDLVIAYVDHSFGGAYKALQVATRSGKRIINICDFL